MQALKAFTERILYFFANKAQISFHLSQNKEFQSLMEAFQDLETIEMTDLAERVSGNKTSNNFAQ
jgi:hypothetical protein